MEVLIKAAILSMLPISELRGGIPLAVSYGINPLFAFIVCILANILVIPIMFLFLDTLHKLFLRINFYKKCFDYYIEKSRNKLEKHIGTKTEFWFILIFTGIPLPMTGAYSAVILSWFFGLRRFKAFLAISLGVIMAGIIVTLVSVGLFGLI